jgi:hypothetical protein
MLSVMAEFNALTCHLLLSHDMSCDTVDVAANDLAVFFIRAVAVRLT